jgi:putative hydrolase of the HAD superfamily
MITGNMPSPKYDNAWPANPSRSGRRGAPPAIRAVLFDAAGTLIDLAPDLTARMVHVAQRHGSPITEDAARRAQADVDARGGWPEDASDEETRRNNWLAFCRELLSDAVVDHDAVVVEAIGRELRDELLDPGSYLAFGDVRPTLDGLRAAGVRIGIVSNFDSWLHEILRRTGIADDFMCVVLSSELGHYKPAPELFLTGLNRLGTTAATTVFVGDSPYSDIGGAESVGMRAVLVDRRASHPTFPGKRVTSLEDLLKLLPFTDSASNQVPPSR